MTDLERLRLGMVDGQIRTADVTDHRVLAAFLAVPRESFVPEVRRDLAYLDARVPLGPAGRFMLEPMTLAKLVQLADVQPGERALVVGCGFGYAAAILAELGASVTALEQDSGLTVEALARLAGKAVVVEGPLVDGVPAKAPFDLIFCDGAIVTGLERLSEQLAPGGRIVAPAGEGRAQRATVFRKNGEVIAASEFFDASGPVLPGFAPAPVFAF